MINRIQYFEMKPYHKPVTVCIAGGGIPDTIFDEMDKEIDSIMDELYGNRKEVRPCTDRKSYLYR